MKKVVRHCFFLVTCFLCGAFVFPGETNTFAQHVAYQSPRFILYFGDNDIGSRRTISENAISEFAVTTLNAAYERYTSLFGRAPQKKVTLRFFDPISFQKYTGAPSWTSAMYFKNEITIPLNHKKGIRLGDLGRAIKHEYAHAVISEISGGRCPAWLDEGLAQMLEGKINSLLGPALRKWIATNKAMPLHWLRNGFTLLDEKIVPAAYAQSLFSARKIVREGGYASISQYLRLLSRGESEPKAFRMAFKKSQKQFVSELTLEIRAWAQTRARNP